MTPNFSQEFHILNYAINESQDILLFAHSRPDGDTVGSVLALREYLKSLGKNVAVACFDPLPSFLSFLSENVFEFPEHLELEKFKLVIACDSVERGFQKIVGKLNENQTIALLDHHPNLTLSGDISIIDPEFSSVCEIVYDFFIENKIELTRKIATFLMLGILSDTGTFRHRSATSRVMEIASDLMKKGAPLKRIVENALVNKDISTLKLWSKAFERAKINPASKMIVSVLTQKDLEECQTSSEGIAQVAGILNTVPGTSFSLILSERGDGIVKGSLRSEEYKEVDVSKIAAMLGGGGHKLASGFEVKGRIMETEEGWKVI